MNIRVRRGDNFWYYSQLFNVPLSLIIDSNLDVNPAALQIGQIVRIPGYYVNFCYLFMTLSLYQLYRTLTQMESI